MASFLEGHEVECSGRALPRDEYSSSIKAWRPDFQGNWRISTYELIDGNVGTHFQANKAIYLDLPPIPQTVYRNWISKKTGKPAEDVVPEPRLRNIKSRPFKNLSAFTRT